MTKEESKNPGGKKKDVKQSAMMPLGQREGGKEKKEKERENKYDWH